MLRYYAPLRLRDDIDTGLRYFSIRLMLPRYMIIR